MIQQRIGELINLLQLGLGTDVPLVAAVVALVAYRWVEGTDVRHEEPVEVLMDLATVVTGIVVVGVPRTFRI